MAEQPNHVLDLHPDHALFGGQIHALVVMLYENEKPPCGLAGLMDWRFQGAISEFLRAGVIQGKTGECAYIPVRKKDVLYHLILAGGGKSPAPGERKSIPSETWHALQRNLASLKFAKIGISREDFGGATEEQLQKHLKGVPVWIVQ